ncbi:MAG TPA: response regulator [Ktedonobacterales bacterium]|nr:response regulator [Ktedonobacterales bacterium]
MPLPTMDEAVMKLMQAEALVEPADAVPLVHQPHLPVILPYEQRIAILVVIPKEAVPTGLLRRLGASGYDVWAVTTGRAAVELAEQTPPDIILLDLDGMYEITSAIKVSGFRVLHLLGRLRNGHPMAVVVMTRLDYTEVEGPVRASADEFVNKPIEPVQLLQRLQGALARMRARYRQRCVDDAAPGQPHGLAAAPAW